MMTARARLLLVLAVVGLTASSAFAQSQGRVIRDNATIWRLDTSIAVTTVRVGAVLDVVRRTDGWYEVLIPESAGGRGDRGRISVNLIELLPGSPEPPTGRLGVNPPPDAGPAQPTSARRAQRVAEPEVGIRAFARGTFVLLTARNSFDAILGHPYGFAFGGGAQMRFRNGFFVEGALDQLRQTGERVFVADDEVFQLGISDTITIRPITATAGYRFNRAQPVVPYLGAGLGAYQLVERSSISEADEETNEWHPGFLVVGGAELRRTTTFTLSFEAEYSFVPNALGLGGVSELYDEHDLGGLQLRVRVLFGR